jgi:CheY-like chemotaxis protein
LETGWEYTGLILFQRPTEVKLYLPRSEAKHIRPKIVEKPVNNAHPFPLTSLLDNRLFFFLKKYRFFHQGLNDIGGTHMEILIVEDEPTAANFFSMAAEAGGYTDVDIAESAEEALALLIQTSYDLITLDIQLPGASGLEILSVIRNMMPQAIIAIISGNIPEDTDSNLAECADAVLSKPVRLDVLNQLLESTARIRQEIETIRNLGKMSGKNDDNNASET